MRPGKQAKLKKLEMISVVIPIHNEEPAILPLYDRLTRGPAEY